MTQKNLYTYLLSLFLVFGTLAWSQEANLISTNFGSSINQTICDGESVTFTIPRIADAVGDIDNEFEFFRRRGITTSTVVFRTQNNVYTTNDIMSGDVFFGRRYNYGQPGGDTTGTLTDEITFQVLTLTGSVFDGGTIVESDLFSCIGTINQTLNVSSTSTGSAYDFQWQLSTDNGSTFNDISGATGENYNISGLVNVSTQYRRRVMLVSGGTCEKFSTVFSIEISDLIPGTLDSSLSGRICYNESPGTLGQGGSLPTFSRGTISYQWEQNINGAGWTDVVGATSLTYTPMNLTQDVQFRRRDINTNSNSGSICDYRTNVISIGVEVEVNSGNVTGEQTICNGEIPSSLRLVGATSGPGITQEWEISDDGINFRDLGVSGDILTFTATTSYTPEFTSYYRARVGTVTCTAISNVVTVTVLPEKVSLSSSAVGGVYCSGDAVEFTATGSATTFVFYLDNIVQQSSSSPTITFTNLVGNHTVILEARTLAGCMRRLDFSLTEVNIEPGMISGDQLICNGASIQTITSVASATLNGISFDSVSSTSYQWQSSPDATIWSNVIGADQATFTPPALLTNSIYFRRLAVNTQSGETCSETSNEVFINIIPSLNGGTVDTANQAVCSSTSSTINTISISGSTILSNISYQWEEASFLSNVFTPIVGATQASYTPSPTDSRRYRRKIFSGTNSATCFEYSTVHEIHFINLDEGNLDPSQSITIYIGSTPSTIVGQDATSSNASITYSWEQSINNGSTWTVILGATNSSYSPPALFQNTMYRRIATATVNGVFCSEETNVVSFTVMNLLDPGVVVGDQVLCNVLYPNDLVLTGVTSGASIVFQWEMSVDNVNYTTISNTTQSLSFTSTTTWNPVADVTYYRVRVTDTATSNSDVSGAASITITPFNLSLTSDGVNNVFCVNDDITFTASGVGSLTYEFYVNGISFQGPSPNNIYVHRNLTRTSTVTVIARMPSGCEQTEEIVMQQNFITAGTISGIQTICSGGSPFTFTSVTEGTAMGTAVSLLSTASYQWQSSFNGTTSWTNILNATSEEYTSVPLNQATYFRRLTVNDLNGQICMEPSNVISVSTVSEVQLGIIDQSDQIICGGSVPISLTVSGGSVGLGVSYQWEQAIGTVTTVFTAIPLAISESYSPPVLNQAMRYRRRAVSNFGGCVEYSNEHTVQVIDLDPGSLDPNQEVTICMGSSIPVLNNGVLGQDATSTTGIISYQWQESSNGGVWTDIASATSLIHQPLNITQDTYYRRVATSTFSGTLCSLPTNSILIQVEPMINVGIVSMPQRICEGDTFANLSISNSPTPAGTNYLYQWQESPDNINFTDIPGENNLTLIGRSLTSSMYYRCNIIASGTNNCIDSSESLFIEVDPMHTLTNIGSLTNSQTVCFNQDIQPVILQYGGGATGISIPDLSSYGLSVFHDPTNRTYTITGILSSTVNFTATTISGSAGDVCSPEVLNFQFTEFLQPVAPNQIFIDDKLIVDDSGQLSFSPLCADTPSSQFSVVYLNPADELASIPTWELISPLNAGIIDASTGVMSWTSGFSGTAYFSVRSQSVCLNTLYSVVSRTFEINVEAVELPPQPPSEIGAISIGSVDLQGGLISGGEPICSINDNTLNTYFQVASLAISGTIDTTNIVWSSEVLQIGNRDVTDAGTIDPDTGIMDWNTGFWGTVNIYADPINCVGDNDPRNGSVDLLLRQTYTIDIPEGVDPFVDIHIAPGSFLPSCPSETASFTTTFFSNLSSTESVTWIINNSNAGTIDPVTGVLSWAPNFSGPVNISAIASLSEDTEGVCEISEGTILVNVPEAPQITLSSGFNSNIVANCNNNAITPIRYTLLGAIDGVAVTGLPSGISGQLTETTQISAFSYSGTSLNSGEVYIISLPLQNYSYTTIAPGETAEYIVGQLVQQINNSDTTVVATSIGSAIFLTGINAGESFRVVPSSAGVNPQIVFTAVQELPALRVFEISGVLNDVEGDFPFVLTSTNSNSLCSTVSSTGMISIRPISTISLVSSNTGQIVCNNSPLTDIVYQIGQAQNADVDPASSSSTLMTDGLPNGVTANYAGGQLVISGTPQVVLSDPTTYSYTIRTRSNRFGCEETIEVGSIVVLPDIEISLLSDTSTQNQQVCEGTSIQAINYQLSSHTNSDNFSYDFSELPNGMVGGYDSSTRRLVISGTPNPSPTINTTTVYTYSLTVSSCSGTQTVTDTITVYPSPRLELISDSGTDNQIICDDNGIENIQYQIYGATGFDHTISPSAPWLSFGFNPATQVINIEGSPNFTVDQETVYTYNVFPRESPFGCNVSPGMSGTITLIPQQELQLTSHASTLNQQICNGNPIDDIVLTFSENVLGTDVSGLPPGLLETTNYYNKVYSLSLVGNNITSVTTFEIKINSNNYSFTTTSTITPSQLANELANLVNDDPDVNAVDDGAGTITITGSVQGAPFSVTTNQSNFLDAQFANKQVVQSHGELIISGVPITSNATITSYSYTISSTGVSCTPNSVQGVIQVDPVPVVTLNSGPGSDSQTICRNSPLIPIEYHIAGSFFGVSVNGLPPGVVGSYDSTSQIFTISGSPNAFSTVTNAYPYVISVLTNPEICDPILISGTIAVNPFERFELTSAPDTISQEVCEGQPMIPIEYGISGNVSQVNLVTGVYPPGVSGNSSSQNLILEISVLGLPTASISETFSVQINDETPVVYQNSTIGVTPVQIAKELVDLINLNVSSIVTATEDNDGVIRLEGTTAGDYFTVTPMNGSFNEPLLQFPVEIQSNLTYTISGTPSLTVTAPVTYSFGLEVIGGLCSVASASGTITLNPNSNIELNSVPASASQTVCELEPISRIEYSISQGGTGATISWTPSVPAGLDWGFDVISNIFYIEGTPSGIANTTNFNYTLTTTGNRYGCEEDSISGSLIINKQDEITLISSVGTDEQDICGIVGSGLTIANIVYELTGTATNLTVTGLPPGLTTAYDPVSKRLTISGVPAPVTTETTYEYFVMSSGALCTSTVVSGVISLDTLPELELTSSLQSTNQINDLAICEGNSIIPIVYTFGAGVSTITVTNLPNGVTYSVLGSRLTISGRVEGNYTVPQVLDYSISIGSDNGCLSDGDTTGSIEVIPIPHINEAFIIANDIVHVTCNGGQDGSINIPELSPAFDLRIEGNQNSIRQIDHITLVNTPALSDVYSIQIEGISYSYTVIPSTFGGSVQNNTEVAQALIDIINDASGAQEAPVVASLLNVSTIVLTAKIGGVPFTVDQVNVNTSGSANLSVTTIQANRPIGYEFSWEGPNGFTSSEPSILNLEAGDYMLTVQINDCTSDTVSFTIEEPEPIVVETESCNGSFLVDVSGGVRPYTFRLFDRNNALIDTRSSNGTFIYERLTPGSDYLFEVVDSQCSIAQQLAVELPFGITFNGAAPLVVPDYCNDVNGSGFIELGGNAAGESFSGGSNQFSYRWTGPNFSSTARDIYDLTPGVYVVTVTDDVLGCTEQANFEIGSVNALTISLDPRIELDSSGNIALACAGDETASIQVEVNGGVGNYSYSWTRNGTNISGANGTRLEDLGEGIYEITVRDAPPSGVLQNPVDCISRRSFTVSAPQPLKIFVNSGTTTQTTYCPEESNFVDFEIELFGGTPPFDVSVTAENGTVINQTVFSNNPTLIRGLNPSEEGENYMIEVEDANACDTQTESVTIEFSSIEAISVRYQVEQIDCVEGKLGSIQLELISGTISNPEQVQVQWISNNFNLYDTWANSSGSLTDIEVGGMYTVIITQGSCELYRAENIEVTDVTPNLLFINDIDVQTGGCNGDQGSISLDIQGGSPPISIQWEQYRSVTSGTISGTATTSVTTTLGWVNLPTYANNAVASQLEVGTYRAIISDATSNNALASCSKTQITNPIVIGTNAFQLANFRITNMESCSTSSATAEINFSILNTLPNNNNEFQPQILLDGSDPGNRLIATGNNSYKIINIEVGQHTLNINTGTSSSVLGDFSNCTISHPFEISEALPIKYSGLTQFEIDPCQSNTQINVDPQSVTGGNPFIINNSFVYDYFWEFISEANPNSTINQTFVGDTIQGAEPGIYNLTISDSSGCSSEIIPFVVSGSNGALSFSVVGSLRDVEGTASETTITNNVKALAPNCLSSTPNGQIGVEISGGLRPYTIEWFKEQITSATDLVSATNSLIPLPNFTNRTYLNNLDAGKYKLIIRSQNSECPENNIASNNYYEEVIIVPNNKELYIVEGPVIVDDDLCRGLPGRVYVKVFDNLQGKLAFYYNNEILSLAEDQPSNEGEYFLLLEKPVDQADFLVSNEEGCSVSVDLQISEIGPPDFRFFSPSQQLDGQIMAKEEITFENTSDVPYSYSTWHFGDGTTETTNFSGGTISPTLHTYGISGSYFVTLRNYNDIGCYEEVSKVIVVGRGFNVLAPNVFSPNNDGINDYFRPLFSGFKKVILRIYDDRGNFLFEEKVEEEDPTLLSGINFQGWSGSNATGSPYYIYQFTGTLISDESVVERTGTFVLIR